MTQTEKYYHILGISPTKDLAVIKKAYRKQALKYHPDKNPSKEAHIRFIEVTFAYEQLINPKRTEKVTSKPKSRTKEEIIAEKIKRAKDRYKQQLEEEAQKDAAYFQKVATGMTWKVFAVGAVMTFFFTSLLCFDYFSISEHKTLDHQDKSVNHLFINKVISAEGENFSVDMDNFWYNENGYPPMYGTYSYLFHDLKTLNIVENYQSNKTGAPSDRMRDFELFDKYPQYTVTSHTSIYGAFPIIHLILIVPMLLLLFKRPTLRFNIWRLLSIWVLYPMILFFMFSNDRIFHLFGVY